MKGVISEYKKVFHREVFDFEECPNEILEPFSAKRMELLQRLDGFLLNGNCCCEFFSTSELLLPNMSTGLQPSRVTPTFYWINDKPNISLAFVVFTEHSSYCSGG